MNYELNSKFQNFMLECVESLGNFNINESVRISNEINTNTYAKTQVSNIDIPLNFIDNVVDAYIKVSEPNEELEEFFHKIYTSPRLETVPVSVLVYDISEISRIKPIYLSQFIKTLGKMIDQSIKDDIDDKEIVRLKSLEFAAKVKKQMVESSLPEFVTDKEIVSYDNKMVQQVNTQYISTVILPFLRSSESTRKMIIDLGNEIKSTINTACENIQIYSQTIVDITNRNENKNPKKTSEIMSIGIRLTYEFSIYMISMYIRKLSSMINNTKAYFDLKGKLLRYFPGGEYMLHESVIDGKADLRDEDIVHSLIRGNSDIYSVLFSKTYNYYKSNMNVTQGNDLGDKFHSLIDSEIDAVDYDKTPYKNVGYILNKIDNSLDSFSKNLEDPDAPFDQILINSELNEQLTKVIVPLVSSLESTKLYENNGTIDNNDLFLSVMNELNHGDTLMRRFAICFQLIYKKFLDIQKDVSDNNNNHYENEARNIETLEWLREFEIDYRSAILLIGKAFINRIMVLKDILEKIDTGETRNVEDILHESTDFTVYAFENAYDEIVKRTTEQANSIIVKSIAESIRNISDLSNLSLFNEVTDNGNNNKSNKPVVNDNSNNQQNNNTNNNTNNNQQNNEKKETLFEKISALIQQIINGMKKNNANEKAEFIKNNKDYLMNRRYTNVSIDNMHTFQTNINFNTALDNMINGVVNINTSNINKDNVGSLYLIASKKPNTIKADQKELGANLTNYYKFGTGSDQTTTISNNVLAEKIKDGNNGMIAFCENYYNNFDNVLQSKAREIEQKMNDLMVKLNEDQQISIITELARIAQYDIGAIANAYRDISNEYYSVLSSLSKGNNNSNNNQNNSNNNQNNSNNNQNNNK